MDRNITEHVNPGVLPLIKTLWQDHNLPAEALEHLTVTGPRAALASSFSVSNAAQASIAAAATMASVIAHHRTGHYKSISVDSTEAAMECTGLFKLNGETPPQFAPLSGLYKTNDGYIRLHANFDHHRDIILDTLGLPVGTGTSRHQTESTISQWKTDDLDTAITNAGGACATFRTFEQWDKHPQAIELAQLPLIEITKIGDGDPRPLNAINESGLPLSHLRILDLTRILAGPVCGRTLAAYGADVMLVNSPDLPNIDSIAETSRGKLSAHIDLQSAEGIKILHSLIAQSHVFIQGYRPGAITERGFGAEELAKKYPGIVCTSLSAFGRNGPWSNRRGFDSLTQTATGFNAAEAIAYDSNTPKAMPVQILDYASGFLMAFGTQMALYKQAKDGGSYHVQVSLARTGLWLRQMGHSASSLNVEAANPEDYLEAYESGFGALEAIPHAARFKPPSTQWRLPSVPPGTHPPQWT